MLIYGASSIEKPLKDAEDTSNLKVFIEEIDEERSDTQTSRFTIQSTVPKLITTFTSSLQSRMKRYWDQEQSRIGR